MRFETLDNSARKSEAERAIRDIFFLSADPRNVSADEAKNAAFYLRWTSYYFEYEPHLIWLAWSNSGEERLMAYLMGCANSSQAQPRLERHIPSFGAFADQFMRYPAHLHINAHPEARGQGVGSKLIDQYVQDLKSRGVAGVHLVTSPESQNRRFYSRNGFNFELNRNWRGHPILFMGRTI